MQEYESPKVRAKRVEITLAGNLPHGLPRISQVNEAWIADQWTIELELQTQDGQIVILPLNAYAIENLQTLFSQVLALRNKG